MPSVVKTKHILKHMKKNNVRSYKKTTNDGSSLEIEFYSSCKHGRDNNYNHSNNYNNTSNNTSKNFNESKKKFLDKFIYLKK